MSDADEVAPRRGGAEDQPLSVQAVAGLSVLAGTFFFAVGVHAWSEGLTFLGLPGWSVIALGAPCVAVGNSLTKGGRRGRIGAIIVCVPVIVSGLVDAFTGGDIRGTAAQLILPGLVLWVLLRMPIPVLQGGRHARGHPGDDAVSH